jgi:hypothetical protein
MWVQVNGQIYLTDSTLALTEPVGGASLGVSTLAEMRGDQAGDSVRIVPIGDDMEGSIEAGAAYDVRVDTTVPGQVRVEWIDMATWSASSTNDRFSFAATLFSSGVIEFEYGTTWPDPTAAQYIGVSIGNGVGSTSSPEVDLSAGADSGTDGLLYQNFGTGDEFDLVGMSLLIVPNGMGGFASTLSCEPARHEEYGAGCYGTPASSLYELFATQNEAKAVLDGNRLSFGPIAGGYSVQWVPGGAASFLAPSAGATELPIFASNNAANITPSSPFPGPGGPVPTLTVSENGLLTMAATPNNPGDSSVTTADLVGSNAPHLGFYAFRDFDLGEAGGGKIKYEEVVVGPDTILAITWDGVEAEPSTISNPATFQFQVNLTSGEVDALFTSWDTSTDASDAIVGATLEGVGINPGETTLSSLTSGNDQLLEIAGTPTFYQLFPDAASAKAQLEGNVVDLVRNSDGYTASWVPGAAGATLIAHTGAATVPAIGSDSSAQVSPSIPFPTPFGPASTLTISENGVLTCAATANDDDSSPNAFEFIGSVSPNLAFAAWANFTLSEVGSGPIQYEEFAVGPDTVLCVTWDAVESLPASAANPTTYQIQMNLTTGDVKQVFSVWDSGTSTVDVLVGATLPGNSSDGNDVNPGSIDLALELPKTIAPLFPLQALSLSAAPPPTFVLAGSSVPITWTTSNLRDLSPAAPGVYLASIFFSVNPPLFGTGVDLTFLGIDAPGCNFLLGSAEVIWNINPSGPTHDEVISFPQPLAPGDTFYSQTVNFILPNSLPTGQNNFGVLTSNGVKSRFDLQ